MAEYHNHSHREVGMGPDHASPCKICLLLNHLEALAPADIDRVLHVASKWSGLPDAGVATVRSLPVSDVKGGEPQRAPWLRDGDRSRRQAMVFAWAKRAFTEEQATSLPQRGLRLLEEAIEAFQSVNGDQQQAHRLVDYVFSRPPGVLHQELGGVGVTVLALAAAAGLSADEEEAREVARVLSKPEAEFARRNAAKNAAGFMAVASRPVQEQIWEKRAFTAIRGSIRATRTHDGGPVVLETLHSGGLARALDGDSTKFEVSIQHADLGDVIAALQAMTEAGRTTTDPDAEVATAGASIQHADPGDGAQRTGSYGPTPEVNNALGDRELSSSLTGQATRGSIRPTRSHAIRLTRSEIEHIQRTGSYEEGMRTIRMDYFEALCVSALAALDSVVARDALWRTAAGVLGTGIPESPTDQANAIVKFVINQAARLQAVTLDRDSLRYKMTGGESMDDPRRRFAQIHEDLRVEGPNPSTALIRILLLELLESMGALEVTRPEPRRR